MNRRGYPGWGVVDLGSLEERHAVSGEHPRSPAKKILDWMRTRATAVRKITQLLLVFPFTSSIFLRTFKLQFFNIPHIQHQYKIHANVYYITYALMNKNYKASILMRIRTQHQPKSTCGTDQSKQQQKENPINSLISPAL